MLPSHTQNRQNKKGKKGKIISTVSFSRCLTRIENPQKKKRKIPKNTPIPSPVAFLLSSEIPGVFLYNSYSDPESSHLCYTDTSQRTSRHLCNFWWIGMKANLENIFVIALIKDLPYCIICGVYIRGNISSPTLLCFWSSCFFIDVILLIGRRKHTITSAPLLFFISLLKENWCIVVYGMYGFQIGYHSRSFFFFQLLKLYILYTTIHQK